MQENEKAEHTSCANRSMGLQIKFVNNIIRREIDSMFAKEEKGDICGMQGPIIGYLCKQSKEQDVFQRDTEKEFNIRRSTATVMLQNLEQKGFVVRIPVKQDARLKKIVLTEKAVKHDEVIQRHLRVFNEHLEEGISPEEKKCFFSTLDKMIENLKR